MTRVRLLLLAVAVGLAIPVGLLVHRALASAEAEERARQQALADTAFAAVERELANLLAREESRAWDEWRHLLVPEGEVRGSEGLVRSPLADLPTERGILGWFQVEPDGAIGSPLLPQDELTAYFSLDRVTTDARERDAEIRGWVSDWLAHRPERPVRPRPEPEPAPARPREVGLLESYGSRAAERSLQDVSPSTAAAPAPQALQEEMAEAAEFRKDKEAKKANARLSRQELAAPSKAEVFQQQSRSELVQQLAMRNKAIDVEDGDAVREDQEPPRRRDAGVLAGSSDAVSPMEPESEEGLTETTADNVEVEVEAFTGELDAAGRLVLQRLVIVAGIPYRQGILIDVQDLASRVDPLELLARTAGTDGTFSLAAKRAPGASFSRRLPAPFDPLQASLGLSDRDGVSGVRTVLALTVLLALVGLLGLFAVDRMVGTHLAYAQRRSDFVSAVTHELKTPLAAIRLHGEMLHEGIAATEEKRSASYRTITAECERLTRLVDNVLELSRLEKGTRTVHLMAGPLEPVLQESLDILRPHASSAGFSLDLEVEDGLSARFDRDALMQVVFNLVDNALKYARDAGDKRVGLVARRDGERVVLLVRDQGPGVPVRHLRRIFEPFWRGERELTRRAKGTGIGLALVRGLVERMQGEVEGRNPAGGGFEVKVTLPGAPA